MITYVLIIDSKQEKTNLRAYMFWLRNKKIKFRYTLLTKVLYNYYYNYYYYYY